MRKLALFIMVLFVGAVVHVSLRSKMMPRADYTTSMMDSLKTLDPAGMHWVDENLVAMALWEGLTACDPVTIESISGVAHWPAEVSEDGLIYTFTLRQDARWSNGDPVVAGDFVYGWRRAIEPGSSGVYFTLITDNIAGAKAYCDWRNGAVRTLLLLKDLQSHTDIADEDLAFLETQGLKISPERNDDYAEMARQFRQRHLDRMEEAFGEVGLRILDDHHLEVRLTHRISYLGEILATSTFMPIHRASLEMLREQDDELTLWSYDNQWVKPDYHHNGYPGLVSNGSFRLADWQFKRYMHFEQNRFYWDRANVKSKSFTMRIMHDPGSSFLAYEQGDVDLYRSINRLDFAPALVQQARQGLRDDIHVFPAYGTYYYWFNCMEKLPDGRDNPLKDARVRMALNMAVDKQSIVENVTKIGNPVAVNLVPPESIPGYHSAPGPAFNVARAQQLLAEAGYPDGQGLPTIEILYNTGSAHGSIAQAVAEMWRKHLHVDTSLIGKEIKSFDEDKNKQNFMVLRASWYGDYTDPTTFLDLVETHNGNNDGRFSNAEYDRLLKQAARCSDPGERMALLGQAEGMLMLEQMPILPIYYYVNITGYRPHLKGVYPNPRDRYLFKHIYIEENN